MIRANEGRCTTVENPMDAYYLSWGTLAFIKAALANIDGRGPLKYFLGSLLLGPFVTLMLATTRKVQGQARQVDLWRGGELPR